MTNTQLLVDGFVVLIAGSGGLFALIRYLVHEQRANVKQLIEYAESNQSNFIGYIEKKNGYMERIAKDFTASNDKATEVIGRLTTNVAILSERLK